ncbi:MAG TPA: pyridoxal-phosphate dependent enzyme [Actinomycetota bacterium]|nr:pyridoxal-phosphate dependent enzyme [Actinomycetota bacterium]
MIALDDVRAAADRLSGVANRTPVLTSRTLNERVGGSVFLKAEPFQRGGAFKFRGAYNKISSLTSEERARGVFAASSGNHAQAVALASRLLGVDALILMPEGAPAVKREATEGYGGTVVTYDRYAADRDEAAISHIGDRILVHPYDDPLIMAGQGTAALELIDDAGPIDVLVCPMSGGGLIAGCATVVTALCPGVRVVGVEPAEANDTQQSLEAGRRIRIDVPVTIADGLQVPIPGELTFEVNRRLVDEVVTVTDEEIVEAMAYLFDRMKVVTEPSGAASVAALLSNRIDVGGRRAGVVISGGNVGVDRFVELMAGRAR